MSAVMWLVLLWALLLPVVAIALGQLSLERDVFVLLVYAQSVIYLNVAPTFAAPEVDSSMQDRYAWVQAWAFVLFQFPLIVLYAVLRKRRERRYATSRQFAASAIRLGLFFAGCMILGVGYFVVAAKYGLLFRRVGEGLADVQLSMSLVEFAFYRTFVEIGLFLLAAQMILLRAPSDLSPVLRRMARAGLTITTILFLGNVLVNSRLYAIVTLVTLYGVATVTGRKRRGLHPAQIAAVALVALTALYMVKVVENIRLTKQFGGSILAPENFLPFAVHDQKQDDTLRWRLNGVDLIAMIANNVETQGPAMGSAWAVPFVLSLDPIVRTAFTVEAKRAKLTSAKTILLLRYGGVSKLDYYNCMLSDAYGNFSIYGFLLVAVILAFVLATATAAMSGSASPLGVLLGAFAVTRLLPFEQEFGMVLYGWLKLVPFVAIAILFYPLRRSTASSREPAAPQGITGTVALST